MTYHAKKVGLKPTNIWVKKAIAILTLILMIPGQLTYAQTIPAVSTVDVQTTLIATPIEQTIIPIDPPTVQDVLLNICKENGYIQDCAKTLLGMLWIESSNISTAIGDGGRARGYFQIHYKLHKIPIACAEDLVCSANWSLNYLEAHSYPRYVKYAVQCHNSCNVNNGYAAKALRHGKRLWDKPLEINQAAPIELAMK